MANKYLNFDGLSHLIDKLKASIAKKVDKEEGKTLSSNDYTDTEKTKLAGIEDGAEVNVQSDWNQNDETADDYVKGRTHWVEKKETVIIEEQTISGFFNMGSVYGQFVNLSCMLEVGNTYTVVWDGESYNCTANETDGVEWIGHDYRNGTSGGDIPFCLEFPNGYMLVTTESTANSHTLSVEGIASVYYKLDVGYMPDEIRPIEFVEEGLPAGSPLRLYSTEWLSHILKVEPSSGRLGIEEKLQEIPVWLKPNGQRYLSVSLSSTTESAWAISFTEDLFNRILGLSVHDQDTQNRYDIILGVFNNYDAPSFSNSLERIATIDGVNYLFSARNINLANGFEARDLVLTIKKLGTATDVQYLDGVTSNVQEQLNGLQAALDGKGAGDMLKSVYDTDGDGIVDNAEKLGGQLPSYYAAASAIPTKTSQLTNDSGFKTTDTTYSQATSSALGLVKIGYSENGKNYPVELNSSGQMFVNVPWTDNNTVYTHPTYTAKSSGLYKVTVDGTGHVSGTAAVTKSDITALGIPAQDTTYTLSSFGVNATSTELNYVSGATSNIQTQINALIERIAALEAASMLPTVDDSGVLIF